MAKIELIDQPVQQVWNVRTHARMEDLPAVFGTNYEKILRYIAQAGGFPAGAPFAAYHTVNPNEVDIEIGFPVAQTYGDLDDVRYAQLPASKAVAAVFQGPYSELLSIYASQVDAAWLAAISAGGQNQPDAGRRSNCPTAPRTVVPQIVHRSSDRHAAGVGVNSGYRTSGATTEQQAGRTNPPTSPLALL